MKRVHNLLCQLGTRWVEQEKAVRATVKITRYPFPAKSAGGRKLQFCMKICQLVVVGKMMDMISPIVGATTLIISRRRMHNGNSTIHTENETTFITVVCKETATPTDFASKARLGIDKQERKIRAARICMHGNHKHDRRYPLRMPCIRYNLAHPRGMMQEDGREQSAQSSPPRAFARPYALLLQEEGELQLHIPHEELAVYAMVGRNAFRGETTDLAFESETFAQLLKDQGMFMEGMPKKAGGVSSHP
ncbi:hypothetical protein CRG98_034726 [Punica granatum]|uniref:Uncharacterized protein n=1 Tax=Punica granatum TaxID=22663 RepID=A0A2I0IL99_PUNGR|nr:hypothetical protein CRG98_034726 [Punica granatum]